MNAEEILREAENPELLDSTSTHKGAGTIIRDCVREGVLKKRRVTVRHGNEVTRDV